MLFLKLSSDGLLLIAYSCQLTTRGNAKKGFWPLLIFERWLWLPDEQGHGKDSPLLCPALLHRSALTGP